ncbi:serine hydrolase [Chitinophaga japonensis]
MLIAEKGKVLYERSFGYADFSTRRPNTASTSFPVASISKTLTATAILQLADRGKLRIADPVHKYLPDFPYPTVTIRHLLSHTSGMPDREELFLSVLSEHPDSVLRNKDIVPAAVAGKVPLSFAPGEDYEYNNVNFDLLALVVEKVSGLKFGKYLEKYIFQPAHMPHTSLSEFLSRKDKDLCEMYRYRHTWSTSIEKPDTVAEFYKGNHNYNFAGSGDMISTARDLFHYDQALYNGHLVGEAMLKEAFLPVKLANGKINPQRYGLGWMIWEDTSLGKIVMHPGGLPGLNSMLLRNISKFQVIILFDNTAREVGGIAENALKILNGSTVPQPRKSGARHYGRTLAENGIVAGNEKLTQIEKDTITYNLDEDELNSLGYEFMRNNIDSLAREVFKTNVRLFPLSWNVYDSYGEILLKNGKKEEAIQMYRRSLELNKENENARKVLRAIGR